jgi:hypothetical protein
VERQHEQPVSELHPEVPKRVGNVLHQAKGDHYRRRAVDHVPLDRKPQFVSYGGTQVEHKFAVPEDLGSDEFFLCFMDFLKLLYVRPTGISITADITADAAATGMSTITTTVHEPIGPRCWSKGGTDCGGHCGRHFGTDARAKSTR